MKPGKYDFIIYQGATFTRTFAYSSAGVLVPVVGYTAKMQLRHRDSSTTMFLEMTTTNGRIICGPADGYIKWIIPDTVTATLDFRKAVYDCELYPPGGGTTRWLQGIVTLDREVTR